MEWRYDSKNRWFKGGTHIHSTASDGGKTFAELAQIYAEQGYDFLFRTDHRIASDVAGDREKYPLLWLDGMEIDGFDDRGSGYHVVCLGTFRGIVPGMSFPTMMETVRAQDGFCILAHPHWMGNSLEDALAWPFDGVEIYNHVCRNLNGKSGGQVHWSALLGRNTETFAFAVDDAHISPVHPSWNGGWIMVNAPACNRETIPDAIRDGNFYATCGPEFHAITLKEKTVRVTTSPVCMVQLVGPAYRGMRVGTIGGPLLRKAVFEIPDDWDYAHLEIEDKTGRRAWTNTLFRT